MSEPRAVHPITTTTSLTAEQMGPATGETVTAPQTPSEDLSVGPGLVVAARYELGHELARGGMGVVYRAIDRQFDREVAVKVLAPWLAERESLVSRFAVESRITARLQHPGIPPVYDVGNVPQPDDLPTVPYLVMKLISGQTLAERLRPEVSSWVQGTLPNSPDNLRLSRIARNGWLWLRQRLISELNPFASPKKSDLLAANPPELSRLIAIFQQVCQAVAYAHDQGILHRDLKPGNVMVGEFGEVQVMDWGLAKQLRSSEEGERSSRPNGLDGNATAAGHVMGTFAYMPPEQARGEVDRLDRRCDVFALGAILCHILTGQPPYTRRGAEFVRQVREGNIQEAFHRLDTSRLDKELVTLAKACLSPDPISRPADAKAVADAVTTYQQNLATRLEQATYQSLAVEATRQVRNEKIGRIAFVAAIIGVLCGTGGMVAWFQLSGAGNPRDAVSTSTLMATDERFPRLPPEASESQRINLLMIHRVIRQYEEKKGRRFDGVPAEFWAVLAQGKLKKVDVLLLALLHQSLSPEEWSKSDMPQAEPLNPPSPVDPPASDK